MTVTPYDQTAPQPPEMTPDEPAWVATVRETARLARYIADTDFVPKAFRGNAAAVTAAMLYGAELGVGRMTALQTMSPIQGKVGISAELMRSLVLAQGHRIELVRLTTDRCTIRGQRAGTDTWQEVTWTLDDAKRADLRGDGWRKYPRAMLMARATTELCRFMFADVLHGIVALEEYVDEPSSAVAAASTPAAPAPTRPHTPPRVVQRGKAAANPTPGTDSPPPARSTPASTEAAPDTSRSAPGESVASSHSAGAGAPKPSPQTGSLSGAGGPTPPSPDAGSVAYPGPEPSTTLFSEPPPDPPTEDTGGASPMAKYAAREYHALMRKLGVEDRDERLFVTRVLADREDLASSADLTEDEGKAVLAVLRRCSSRSDLEEVVAAALDATT